MPGVLVGELLAMVRSLYRGAARARRGRRHRPARGPREAARRPPLRRPVAAPPPCDGARRRPASCSSSTSRPRRWTSRRDAASGTRCEGSPTRGRTILFSTHYLEEADVGGGPHRDDGPRPGRRRRHAVGDQGLGRAARHPVLDRARRNRGTRDAARRVSATGHGSRVELRCSDSDSALRALSRPARMPTTSRSPASPSRTPSSPSPTASPPDMESTSMLKYLALELRRSLRDRRYLLLVAGWPVGRVPALLHRLRSGRGPDRRGLSPTVAIMVAMATFGAMGGVLMASGPRLAMDRQVGWLRQLRLTPLSPARILAARLISAMALSLPAIVLTFVAAVLVKGVTPAALGVAGAGAAHRRRLPSVRRDRDRRRHASPMATARRASRWCSTSCSRPSAACGCPCRSCPRRCRRSPRPFPRTTSRSSAGTSRSGVAPAFGDAPRPARRGSRGAALLAVAVVAPADAAHRVRRGIAS